MLTIEQQNIIYNEGNLYVSAKAGSGKTTTLLEYARIRKAFSFLYIVYNQSIKEEAQKKFPPNTTVETIHSLAYKAIGNQYKQKLTNNLKADIIIENSRELKTKPFEEAFKLSLQILNILKYFFNSNQTTITEELCHHDPLIFKITNDIYQQMIDINNKNMPITHDCYLKLYHLTNPILDFDYILIDEAQDSNPVMLDIIYQQQTDKIFVGDPHQRIYSFRNAINVFSIDNPYYQPNQFKTLTLSKSFRFGKNIAKIANQILKDFKNEKQKIIGNEDKKDFVGPLDKNEPYTIISRTNAKVFENAYMLARQGKTFGIVGGLEQLLSPIKDIFYLYKGKKDLISRDSIKKFKNYTSFKRLTEELKIVDFKFLVKVIDTYGDSLEEVISLIEKNHKGLKLGHITLTTAHKSKGLEFLNVKIDNDFGLLNIEDLEEDEINLIYVAVTRAIEHLELNSNLAELF